MMAIRKLCKVLRDDRGQREERVVDIYESADTSRHHRVDLPTQAGGAHTQKHLAAVQRNPFRAAALILGLLCLLLVVGVTVLSKFYISVILDKYMINKSYVELQTSYKELQTSYKQLQTSYDNSLCHSEGNQSQTQGNITRWKRFRCSCYYKSTEMKSWTDGRKDCQTRGADLVIINGKEEHEFVTKLTEQADSWIGLQSVKIKDWPETWDWKWVDGSIPSYLTWKVEVNSKAVSGSTGYINLKGAFNHINSGSQQWICEKPIY
uniref:C-type lectin domain-containing protein n=1 Tax=Dicentrarchus labrax TaxID=13489 RepID=A0A8P4FX34_DICLA